MIRPETVELIRPSGGDVAFRINRPLDGQRPCIRRRCCRQPFGELDLELIPHAAGGRGVLQEEVHHKKLADFNKVILLLVGARHGPGPGIGGEIAGRKGGTLPREFLLNPLKPSSGIEGSEIEGSHRPFRHRPGFLPYPRKVGSRKVERDVRSCHL